MNYSKQFVRKIIYIVSIAILLIPLSLIGRPSTRDKDNAIQDQGGVLSQLRNNNDLSMSGLSQIDPAGETMKLASLGLRGLAVNILWMQAIDAKQKKEWDNMAATLNTLVKLQPNFIKVWEYQAHNLSYNVSVEFDDYEYRYSWIKKGINFLTNGIDANKRDHRIVDTLGFFSGTKFGTADEKLQYRRLFRRDDEFHKEMGEFVNSENLDTPHDPDNWLLAYEWYRMSESMVENGLAKLRRREMIFYNNRPAQKRNLMLALQKEFPVEGDYANKMWSEAHEEWLEYGRRPISADRGLSYNLELMGQDLDVLRAYREELDKLAPPGTRAQLRNEALTKASALNRLSTQEIELMNMPTDQLTDEQRTMVRQSEAKLYDFNRELEYQITETVPEEDREEALRLSNKIYEIFAKMRKTDADRTIINYSHWRNRTIAESEAKAIEARQAYYDATELYRKSILDEYTEVNPVTNEKSVKNGAIQEFERVFQLWADILEQYPNLTEGALSDDLVDDMLDYESIRQTAGLIPYIYDHPLQALIDYKAIRGEQGGLKTTEEVNDILEDIENRDRRSKKISPIPNIDFSLDSAN